MKQFYAKMHGQKKYKNNPLLQAKKISQQKPLLETLL